MSIPWPDETIFEPFKVFETMYKTVGSHEVKCAVLVPRNLEPGKHPVVLNIHGGFLMTGHSLFAPFFSPWVCNLAVESSAIVVSPDYRLLPTQNGVADVSHDLEDFWQWSRCSLAEAIHRHAPGHVPDLSKVLLSGASAGGYGCMQLAISHADEIAGVGLAYPLIELFDRMALEGPADGEPTVLRWRKEDIPSEEATLAWLEEKRQEVATKAGFERSPFCVGATQYGHLADKVLDPHKLRLDSFLPMERIKAGGKLPPKIWLMHGELDSAVPVRSADHFAQLVRETQPQTRLRYDRVPGKDHALDLVEESWASFRQDAMDFLKDKWST